MLHGILLNGTGVTIPAGTPVKPLASADSAVQPTAAGNSECIGIAARDILAGQYGPIVSVGIVQVLIDNAGGCTRGDFLAVSAASAGKATASALVPASGFVVGRAAQTIGAAGLVLAYVSLFPVASASGGDGYAQSNVFETGRRYICNCTGGRRGFTVFGAATGLEYAMSLTIPRSLTLAKVGFIYTTGSGGILVRMGLRNTNTTTRKPTSLIVDGGEATLGAGGGYQTWTLNQPLTPGHYRVVLVCSGSIPNMDGIEEAYAEGTDAWSASVVASERPAVGWTCTQAYGPLAANWSAAGEAVIPTNTAPAFSYEIG